MSASSAYALKETYSWKQPRATPMLRSIIQSYTVYISTLVCAIVFPAVQERNVRQCNFTMIITEEVVQTVMVMRYEP